VGGHTRGWGCGQGAALPCPASAHRIRGAISPPRQRDDFRNPDESTRWEPPQQLLSGNPVLLPGAFACRSLAWVKIIPPSALRTGWRDGENPQRLRTRPRAGAPQTQIGYPDLALQLMLLDSANRLSRLAWTGATDPSPGWLGPPRVHGPHLR
jgi:hypothetical protein